MLEIQYFLAILIVSITLCATFVITHKVKEFKVNDYLKLKLENGRTNIYVKNRVFRQCMYLLLNIPVDRIRDYDMIDSIDEAAEVLDRSLEGSHSPRIISPEEEFMGHCSNIQVWVENDYDTRILHRNLAFPLLKRLSDVGDLLAKKKFKEEIAIRYSSGHPTVITFLSHNGYLKYLTSEELECLLDDNKLPILSNISNNLKRIIESSENDELIKWINYSIKHISKNLGIHNLPFVISSILSDISENYRKRFAKAVFDCFKTNKKFPLIKYLNNNLKYLDEIELDSITYDNKIIGLIVDQNINLRYQHIEDISNIRGLEGIYSKMEVLDLSNNNIKKLDGIENFINLKILKLNNNRISQIEGLENLKKLQSLSLRNNLISEIQGFDELPNLEYFDLSGNKKINKIPETLNNSQSLKILKLSNCNIENFSDSVSRFFWMEQNYRFFSNYSQEDVRYYEKTHIGKAGSDNQLYKHFVKWVLKIKSIMLELKITYGDLEKYERISTKNAIWGGKATIEFKKWLYNKKQTTITSFM